MTVQAEPTRGARVIFIPPPLYYGAGFATSLLLDRLIPLPVGGRPATTVAGIVVGGLGLALSNAGVAVVPRSIRAGRDPGGVAAARSARPPPATPGPTLAGPAPPNPAEPMA